MRRSLSSRLALFGSFAPLVLAFGCSQPKPAAEAKPVDTRAADEQAVRAADIEWSKVAATRDLDATVAFYSDDASIFPPNAPVGANRQAIRDVWAGFLAPAVDEVSWQAGKVDVARSGELAYLTGTYKVVSHDAKGNASTEIGKMVEVWKKQADGKWKVVADIFNADAPAPPAPVIELKPAKKK
jgi:ketosteroid isomerase-like protein